MFPPFGSPTEGRHDYIHGCEISTERGTDTDGGGWTLVVFGAICFALNPAWALWWEAGERKAWAAEVDEGTKVRAAGILFPRVGKDLWWLGFMRLSLRLGQGNGRPVDVRRRRFWVRLRAMLCDLLAGISTRIGAATRMGHGLMYLGPMDISGCRPPVWNSLPPP